MKKRSIELEETEHKDNDTSPEVLLWRWVLLRALLDASLEPTKKNRIHRDQAIAFLSSTSAEMARHRAYVCHSARIDPEYFYTYVTSFLNEGRKISLRELPEGFDSPGSTSADS